MGNRARHIGRNAQGFTLVELMIVVALIGILAALALSSFSRNRTQNEVDNWISTNRDVVVTASRRAMSTRTPYLVRFTATSAQYCQVATLGVAPAYTGTQTLCTGLATTVERGNLKDASNLDARTAFYSTTADIIDSAGTYVAPSKTAIGSGITLYFGPNGAVSTSVANVMSSGLPNPASVGFSLYVRRETDDIGPYRRRLVVYGIAGKTRILDRY